MDATSLITQSSAQQAQAAYADSLSARALAAQQAAANGATPNMAKIKQAAQQFEGFFVGQMMEYMMADLHPDATFGGGQAEETWRSMLNQEYGKEIAKSGKLGISDWIVKSMVQSQQQHAAAAAKLSAMDGAAAYQADAVLPQATAAAAGTAKANLLNVSA
jgi:Rod binding domain-containing protein